MKFWGMPAIVQNGSDSSPLCNSLAPVRSWPTQPVSARSTRSSMWYARVPERAQLPFPADGAVARLRDKRELAKLAGGLDLAVPTIWEGRASSLAAASFPLPLWSSREDPPALPHR